MNREQFTLKANQAIQDCVRALAGEHGNQEIVPLHLVKAILAVPENLRQRNQKKNRRAGNAASRRHRQGPE